MKAALNGALNCSILDGWWDELVRRRERLGHLVGRDRRGPRPPRRDRGQQPVRPARAPDRAALLRPRRAARCPGAGCARVKPSLRLARARRSSASRMVRDYVDAALRAGRPPAPTGSAPTTTPRAEALAAWKARVPRGWHGGAHRPASTPTPRVADLGTERTVSAAVVARRRWRRRRRRAARSTARSGQDDELEAPDGRAA